MSYSFEPYELPSLPPKRLHQRPVFWLSIAGAAAAAAVVWALAMSVRDPTLHVVNGYDVAVEVRLETGARVTVSPREVRTLSASAGPHRATIAGGGRPDREAEFAIDARSGWDRLLKKQAFVLNVDGAAPVVWQQMAYRETLIDDDPAWKEVAHAGETFFTYDDVDYLFEPFPDEVALSGKMTLRTRVGLDAVPTREVLGLLPESVTPDRRMSFLEAHLDSGAKETQLYKDYAELGFESDPDRCRRFLEAGLDTRPVNVRRHLAYQAFRLLSDEREELLAEYRKRLEADPKSSAWPYLVGRLERDPQTAGRRYAEAIDADPGNPFPWYGRCELESFGGDYAAARRAGTEACRLEPSDHVMRRALFVARLGAGDAAALETELRREWNADKAFKIYPDDLLEVLAIQGKRHEISAVASEYERRARAAGYASGSDAVVRVRMEAHYHNGEYRRILLMSRALPAESERVHWNFNAQLADGDLDAAGRSIEEMGESYQGWAKLALSVAMWSRGRTEEANELFDDVYESFIDTDDRHTAIALLLGDGPDVEWDDVRRLQTREPFESALVLTALAQRCPALRTRLLDLAEKQNFRPWPYQVTVRNAVAQARTLKN